MRMMRIRGVWTTNLAAFLVGFGMYGSFILIPQFLADADAAPATASARRVTRPGCSCCPPTLDARRRPAVRPPDRRFGSRLPLFLGTLLDARLRSGCSPSSHDHRWEFYVGAALLGIGIGLAFAAMANLIVEAVAAGPDRRRDRHEHHADRRRPVGGQVGASVIAAPRRRRAADRVGFTAAFALAGGACLLAAFASVAVPRPVLAPVPVPAGA